MSMPRSDAKSGGGEARELTAAVNAEALERLKDLTTKLQYVL